MATLDLMVVAFQATGGARLFFEEAQALDRDGKIVILDAVLLTKDSFGNTAITETSEVEGDEGALLGAASGGLMGLLAGPIGGIVGLVAGATAGTLAAQEIDFGVPDEMVEDLRKRLTPNSSVLVLMLERSDADEVRAALDGFLTELGGQVAQFPVNDEVADKIKAKAKRKPKHDQPGA